MYQLEDLKSNAGVSNTAAIRRTAGVCLARGWNQPCSPSDRRATPIPRVAPDALTPLFSTSASKQQQWAAFARDLATDVPP